MSSKEQTITLLQATFSALENQRDRCFALVSAARNSLSTNKSAFNELQLLEIAEEELGDISEFQSLSKLLELAA